jgi:hypothetical protein
VVLYFRLFLAGSTSWNESAAPKREKTQIPMNILVILLYIYSLKNGINGEFLTPFQARHIQTTLDSYIFILSMMMLVKEKLKNHE